MGDATATVFLERSPLPPLGWEANKHPFLWCDVIRNGCFRLYLLLSGTCGLEFIRRTGAEGGEVSVLKSGEVWKVFVYVEILLHSEFSHTIGHGVRTRKFPFTPGLSVYAYLTHLPSGAFFGEIGWGWSFRLVQGRTHPQEVILFYFYPSQPSVRLS